MTRAFVSILALCAATDRAAVMSKLETMRIDVNFEDEPRSGLIRFLAGYTGLNFILDPEAPLSDF
jgi:hypothetical protein